MALAGCSAHPDFAEVSGTVTLDGKPLAGAGVNFKPNYGAVGSAITDAEGRYRLRTGSIDGALIGDHQVTVAKLELVPRNGQSHVSTENGPGRAGRFSAKWFTPVKYSDPKMSGLTAVVRKGRNNIPIELSSN